MARLAFCAGFLRAQCGSLEEAFHALDTERSGYLNSTNFARGLTLLGYKEDVETVFQGLDTAGRGFLTLETFTLGFGGEINRISYPGAGAAEARADVEQMLQDLAADGSNKDGASISHVIEGRLKNVEKSQKLQARLVDDMSLMLQRLMEKQQPEAAAPNSSRTCEDITEDVDRECNKLLDNRLWKEFMDLGLRLTSAEKRISVAEGVIETRAPSTKSEASSIISCSHSEGLLTSRLDEAYRALDLRMMCVQEKMAASEKRLRSIESRFANVSQDIDGEKSTAEPASSQDRSENASVSVNKRVEFVSERTLLAEGRLKSVEDRLTMAESLLTAQDTMVQSHESSLRSLMEASDQMRNEVEAQQQQATSVSENFPAAQIASMLQQSEQNVVEKVLEEARLEASNMLDLAKPDQKTSLEMLEASRVRLRKALAKDAEKAAGVFSPILPHRETMPLMKQNQEPDVRITLVTHEAGSTCTEGGGRVRTPPVRQICSSPASAVNNQGMVTWFAGGPTATMARSRETSSSPVGMRPLQKSKSMVVPPSRGSRSPSPQSILDTIPGSPMGMRRPLEKSSSSSMVVPSSRASRSASPQAQLSNGRTASPARVGNAYASPPRNRNSYTIRSAVGSAVAVALGYNGASTTGSYHVPNGIPVSPLACQPRMNGYSKT